MKSNRRTKRLLILTLFLFLVCMPFEGAFAYGLSSFESHHVYPKRLFGRAGDKHCIQIREFEHRWIENSGGFRADWNHYKDVDHGELVGLGNDISAFSKRKASAFLGRRTISYHLFFVDHNKNRGNGKRSTTTFVCVGLDGVSNILYNVSYIFSIPAKFVHFTSFCLKASRVDGVIVPALRWIWMVFHLVLGFFAALIMLVVGTVLGTLSHPFETLANISFSITDPWMTNLIWTIWDLGYESMLKPVIHIVFWRM